VATRDDEAFRKQIAAIVRRTCQEQGVPEQVTDPVVLGRIARILCRPEPEPR
jgi:hypothetical protein